jgi:hypothetical protein
MNWKGRLFVEEDESIFYVTKEVPSFSGKGKSWAYNDRTYYRVRYLASSQNINFSSSLHSNLIGKYKCIKTEDLPLYLHLQYKSKTFDKILRGEHKWFAIKTLARASCI